MPSMLSLGVLALSLTAGEAKLVVPKARTLFDKQLERAGVSREVFDQAKSHGRITTKSDLIAAVRQQAGVRGREAGECMDFMMDPNALSACAGETEDDFNCSDKCNKQVADLMSACEEPGEDTSTGMAMGAAFMGIAVAMVCDPCMQSFMIIDEECPEDAEYDDMCGSGKCADAISDLTKCDMESFAEMMEAMGGDTSDESDESDMSMGAAVDMLSSMCTGCTAAMMSASSLPEDNECETMEDDAAPTEALCAADCVGMYAYIDKTCTDEELTMMEMSKEDIDEMRAGVGMMTQGCEDAGFEVTEFNMDDGGDGGAAPGASFLAALC